MAPIEGKVAQVISERDVAINRGRRAGVEIGMIFRIMSPEPEEIHDPDTGDLLGAVDVTKVEVEVIAVQDNLAVCRTFKKVVTPGRPARPGISSPFNALGQNIFGDPGTPESERYQTLRTDEEEFVARELDPEGSYVKRGDRAVQVPTNRRTR